MSFLDLYHVFTDKKQNIFGLFSPKTLRLFKIDASTYKILNDLETNKLTLDDISRKYDVSIEQLDKDLTQVNKILRAKKPPRITPLSEITKIILHISNACNLACSYCYASGGDYGNERSLMSKAKMDRVLEFLSKWGTKQNKTFIVQFFGGEPLLNWKKMEYFLKSYRERNLDFIKGFSIVTNGTIYNENIHRILNEYNITTVVSLDGSKEITNLNRKDRKGVGVYDDVIETLEKLNKDRKFSLSIEATYTPTHIEKGVSIIDIIDLALGLGVDGIHIAPSGYPVVWSQSQLEDLKKEFAKSVEYQFEVIRKSSGKFFYTLPQKYFLTLFTRKPNNNYCPAGTTSFAISTDGGIYPCYSLTGIEKLRMTSIDDVNATFDLDAMIEENRKKYVKLDNSKCRDCWVQSTCVSCMYTNYFNSGKMEVPDEKQCELEKYVLERLLVRILEEQQDREGWREIAHLFAGKNIETRLKLSGD